MKVFTLAKHVLKTIIVTIQIVILQSTVLLVLTVTTQHKDNQTAPLEPCGEAAINASIALLDTTARVDRQLELVQLVISVKSQLTTKLHHNTSNVKLENGAKKVQPFHLFVITKPKPQLMEEDNQVTAQDVNLDGSANLETEIHMNALLVITAHQVEMNLSTMITFLLVQWELTTHWQREFTKMTVLTVLQVMFVTKKEFTTWQTDNAQLEATAPKEQLNLFLAQLELTQTAQDQPTNKIASFVQLVTTVQKELTLQLFVKMDNTAQVVLHFPRFALEVSTVTKRLNHSIACVLWIIIVLKVQATQLCAMLDMFVTMAQKVQIFAKPDNKLKTIHNLELWTDASTVHQDITLP